MSGRRHSGTHDSHSPDPIVLERDPQIYNLFRTRRKRVHIVEESPIRSRRQQRRHRTPSPSPPRSRSSSPPPPPSPPRGAFRRMTTRLDDDDIFAPLPPKLPHKSKHKYPKEDDIEYVIEERKPQRYRKVRVHHAHPSDEDAYPKVEIPSASPRKRDSGKFYGEGRFEDREYERRRASDDVQKLTDDFNHLLAKEKRERHDAERAAAVAEEKASRLEADLQHERRQRSLEQRERAANDRERRLTDERDRLVEVRRPVVVHNPIAAVVPIHDNHRSSALDRAQADFRRLEVRHDQPARDEQRPSTGDRGSQRQNIVIVEDPRDRRDRGHRRR